MVLFLRKLYLYFTKDPEAVHYFPGGGGGVHLFPRGGGGVQMLISIETHICTCYFPRESVLVVASWHIDIFNKCPDLRNLMIYQQDCLRKGKISTLCNCFYMCFI